jgi:hypothetical protein
MGECRAESALVRRRHMQNSKSDRAPARLNARPFSLSSGLLALLDDRCCIPIDCAASGASESTHRPRAKAPAAALPKGAVGIAHLYSVGLLQVIGPVGSARLTRRSQADRDARPALGVPSCLLAWYHGDRGQQRVKATELTIPPCCFCSAVASWRYQPHDQASVPQVTAFLVIGRRAVPPDDKSIAVLPLRTCLPKKIDTCLTALRRGELLNRLAQSLIWKVIAPRSRSRREGRNRRDRRN